MTMEFVDLDVELDRSLHKIQVVFKLIGLNLLSNCDCKPGVINYLLENSWHCMSMLQLGMVLFCEVTYLLVALWHFTNFHEVLALIPCIGYCILGFTKIHPVSANRHIVKTLLLDIRDMWPRGRLTADEKNIVKWYLDKVKIVITVYFWTNTFLLLVFILLPVLKIIYFRFYGHDVELSLPFFYWLPFDPYTRGVYEIVLFLQMWQGSIAIWSRLGPDLLFCVATNHICMMFKLLQNKFSVAAGDKRGETNSPPSSEDHDGFRKLEMNHFNNARYKNFRTLLVTHQKLIRMSELLEWLFSFSLLVNFMTSSVVICFCGFYVVVIERFLSIMYKMFLVSALLQIGLLCWYGELLLVASAGVCTAAYNSLWYAADAPFRQSLLILMHRSQKPVCVTTYKFFVLSLSSYTGILRASWSYFMLLMTIFEPK